MFTQAIQPGCTGCSGGNARCVCHRPRRRAALMINLGTPDSPSVSDVRRYLREFLSDPFVIQLPRYASFLTPVLASAIAQFRGHQSAEAYKKIWWEEGSPLRVITQRQQELLKDQLGSQWEVYSAMRYGTPNIREAVNRMLADEVTDVVVVPMYPQWAGPTTETAVKVLYHELHRHAPRLSVTVRSEWYADHGYIESQAQLINHYIAERGLAPETSYLLFSTHSMPESYIRKGDPYEGQIRQTVELVRRRLGWPADRSSLSFQSKLGPVPWLAPSTKQRLEELAEQGERDVVVCPISFTADCLETLEEIGMLYADQFAEQSGGGQVHLVPALNEDKRFIRAMASLVRKGPTSMDLHEPIKPLKSSSEDESISALISRLVLVGTALPGRLGSSSETGYIDETGLRSLCRERMGLHASVQKCGALPHVDGCFVLKTCQRIELYALIDHGGAAKRVIPGLRSTFFEHADASFEPAVSKGLDAYRRLLRTALGLNSTLPGDADVIEQLHTARQMAEQTQTLCPGLSRVLDEVDTTAAQIRKKTAWGRFMSHFASAAMANLDLDLDPTAFDGIIIGGSTTSKLILRLITAGRPGDSDRLTFVYRGSGRKRLIKYIRRVAPLTRRLRVDRYSDAEVHAAIGGADTVFLGIDSREAVLHRNDLEGLRDFTKQPLNIVDFNSYGSTTGLDGLEGVRLINARQLGKAACEYGESQIAKPGFADAYEEATQYIEKVICKASGAKMDCGRMKGSRTQTGALVQNNGTRREERVSC